MTSALQEFKALMVPGVSVDVTNNYITREDHPCYGTHQRVVTWSNGSSWHYVSDETGDNCMHWPKSRNIQRGDNGAFIIFGHPTDNDLFLTVVPTRQDDEQ